MFTMHHMVIWNQFLIKAMKHLLWKLTDFFVQHINRILEQIVSMCALEHLVRIHQIVFFQMFFAQNASL